MRIISSTSSSQHHSTTNNSCTWNHRSNRYRSYPPRCAITTSSSVRGDSYRQIIIVVNIVTITTRGRNDAIAPSDRDYRYSSPTRNDPELSYTVSCDNYHKTTTTTATTTTTTTTAAAISKNPDFMPLPRVLTRHQRSGDGWTGRKWLCSTLRTLCNTWQQCIDKPRNNETML